MGQCDTGCARASGRPESIPSKRELEGRKSNCRLRYRHHGAWEDVGDATAAWKHPIQAMHGIIRVMELHA